jgi:surfactin synthase thioesterase subunit
VNDWLLRRSRRPAAGHRLYCFPFAGGSPGVYLPWEQRLPEVEVWGVLPPGRGKRYAEPPIARVPELIQALVTEVEFRAPFLLFGHSLGALLAFETARALQAAGRPGPVAIVVSAHRPPHHRSSDEPITGWPDAEFRAEVQRRYPPPPPELAEDPELLEQSYRMLRADLMLAESYRYVPGPPLSCPIEVVSGLEDYWTEQELQGWARHTNAGCRITIVPGDHHYLPAQPDGVLRIVAELTAGVLR